jgi:hypothetical protein
MASLSYISPDQTVRQVASACPACADVLRKLPGAWRGDRWSLQQLGPFAHEQGLDERSLLEELSRMAGVALQDRSEPSRSTRSPMPLIFTALIVCIALGASFGVGLLFRIATGATYEAVPGAVVHVHGLAQFWGWVTLFIFAVGGHLLRQNTARPAPRWLELIAALFIVAGLLTFFAGLINGVRESFPGIDIVGSSLLLIAAILFGVAVTWMLSGAVKNQRRHGLMALVCWLWAWAIVDLCMRIRFVHAPVLPDWARTLLIILPVLGLATNAIYGFGIRLVPGVLNIGRLRSRWFSPALILHNIGLCLFLIPLRIEQAIGAACMLAGAICYVIGMDFLRSKPSRPIYGIDPRGHILIRVAFFWLVVGLAMILAQQFFPALPHAYSGAWRHALTVGFITTMILGVGYRILPIFIKQPLASTRLMLISAALIIVGNAGRVSLELLTIGGWTWSYRIMGITGVLELAALILFAINLAATVLNRRRVYSSNKALTPNTRVQEAVNVHPGMQERLQELGVTMFDDSPFIAPSMTLGALALASGITPGELTQSLKANSLHGWMSSGRSCALDGDVCA